MPRSKFQFAIVLKGHSYSRAELEVIFAPALAAEGCIDRFKTIPRGLKPGVFFGSVAARLKPCPFKARILSVFMFMR